MAEQLFTPHTKFNRRKLLELGGSVAVVGSLLVAAGVNWRDVRGILTTSGGPYLNLDWSAIKGTTPNQNWASFEGDPKAGPQTRDWHTVGIMAANMTDIRKLQTTHPTFTQAIAFADTGGHIQAGYNSAGDNLFAPEPSQPHRLLIGTRIGPAAVRATMGIYEPDQHLFIPMPTEAIDESTTTDDMTLFFPGVGYA